MSHGVVSRCIVCVSVYVFCDGNFSKNTRHSLCFPLHAECRQTPPSGQWMYLVSVFSRHARHPRVNFCRPSAAGTSRRLPSHLPILPRAFIGSETPPRKLLALDTVRPMSCSCRHTACQIFAAAPAKLLARRTIHIAYTVGRSVSIECTQPAHPPSQVRAVPVRRRK